MEKVIRFFASNSRVTFLFTVLILVAGMAGLYSLKRESFPTVDFATMSIETIYAGASPDEVEDLISIPLENELRTVDGIDKVFTVSQAGQSEITVQIQLDGYDSDEVMDEAQRAIQRAILPTDLPNPPRVIRVNSGEIPVFEVAVTGPNKNRERDQIAEDLQDLLEDVKGVANVRMNGYLPRELLILVDQKKLSRYELSLEEVNRMLRSQLKDIPGGYVKSTDGSERLVRVRGKTSDPKVIENLIVRGTSGGEIRVKEIGRVVDGSAEADVVTRLNGESATLLTITKQATTDTVDLVEGVKAELEKFNKRLPVGYMIQPYTNEANRVLADLFIVKFNAALGLILILIVLLVLLPGTTGIVASISLPLIVFALAFGMDVAGLTFNSITMIAAVIVIGLLVDNSAVVAEGYTHNRSKGMLPLDASVKAATVFFVPIFATVLCNFAGFAPMLVTTGVMGQFIYSIPVVITIALVFSLVETFFLLPARLKYTLTKPVTHIEEGESFEAGWFGRLQRRFHKIITKLVARRYLTMFAISGFFISSLVVSAFLNKFELFPTDTAEWYIARFETKFGSSVEKTDAIAEKLSKATTKKLTDQKVTYNAVVAFSGVSRIDSFDPQGRRAHNVGFVLITLPEEEAMKVSARQLVSSLSEIKIEGAENVRWQELVNGPPVGRALNIIFKSSKEEQLQGMIKDFKEQVTAIEGSETVEDDQYRVSQELMLNLKQDELRRSNLSVEQVGEAVQTALQGNVVSKLNMRSREVLVRVRYEQDDRKGIHDVRDILVPTNAGSYVPLSSVANVTEDAGPVIRKRFNFHRAVTVTAGVNPEKLTSVEINAKARDIIAKLQEKYPDVAYTTAGEEENTQKSMISLVTALVISIFAILGILVIMYSSYGKAFLVLSTIPLGLAGVSYIFWIAGIPLSFMALIGVIGLGGVVVNASIVLVAFINDARKSHPDRPIAELVAEVTALRFKAVFITNVTTIMGLIPTAYGIGGEDPFLMPLTLAMGWGLLVGSALAIIWIPAGYLALEDLHAWIKRRKART